jgi:hypothetical protein
MEHLLWMPVLLFLLSLVGVVFAIGLPKLRLVQALSILNWPPRIRPIVIHAEQAITHEFTNRVFVGRFSLPRAVYLNDSKIISASVVEKWQSQSEKEIKASKDLITRETIEYAIFASSGRPKIINNTNSVITNILAESFVIEPQVATLFIEAGLIIGGAAVSGERERVQRKKLETDVSNFRWTLGFDKSGVHEVQLIVRAISVRDDKERVFELYKTPIHKIRVRTLDGLTQRQVLWGSVATGFMSASWIVIQAAIKLGDIHCTTH